MIVKLRPNFYETIMTKTNNLKLYGSQSEFNQIIRTNNGTNPNGYMIVRLKLIFPLPSK